MLRAYINHRQTNWDLLLTGAEFAYNDSVHASTGFTPFFLNHGDNPLTPMGLLQPQPSAVPSVEDFVQEQSHALLEARAALTVAQERQAENADRLRRDHSLKVGDRVLLDTTNLTMASDRSRPSWKLCARFVGPFSIL
jgi:hypothetical protein